MGRLQPSGTRGDAAEGLLLGEALGHRYFTTPPERLVTKTELRQPVWAGTHVTDTVLRVCIREIRAALEDAAEAPQYLQNAGRQGYQWLVPGDGSAVPPAATRPIVGRQAEVEALERWFARAATGDRQLVFLSGERGSGMRTVLDLWLTHPAARSGGSGGGSMRGPRGWGCCCASKSLIPDNVYWQSHR